jgi:hypothetical protein
MYGIAGFPHNQIHRHNIDHENAPQGPADAPPMPEPHLITTKPHLNTTKPHLNTTQPHHAQGNRPTRLLGGQPAEERLLAGDNLRRRAVLVVLVCE